MRATAKKLGIILCLFFSKSAYCLTANKVWFENHDGFYRVFISYTIPDLKELREAYAEFTKLDQAKKFYFGLLQGGEFFLSRTDKTYFVAPKVKPRPW